MAVSGGHSVGPDTGEAKPQVGTGLYRRDRARRRLAAARGRYEGSWGEDLVARLKDLDLGKWTTVFGAELLWSVLPLLILLSSLANHRVDDDLSRHIGASGQAIRILEALFRHKPVFAVVPILTGLLLALVGTISIVHSIQDLYERVFGQQHRGWRDIPRFIVWLAVLLVALTAEGFVSGPVHRTAGPVIEGLIRFVAALLFMWWTMHFLLAGRTPWRILIRPALVTAVLWLGLAIFSSVSLSTTIVSDTRLYGTIGVVFTLLTWFILVAAVLVLGAILGAVWQDRRSQGLAVAHFRLGRASAKANTRASRSPAERATTRAD